MKCPQRTRSANPTATRIAAALQRAGYPPGMSRSLNDDAGARLRCAHSGVAATGSSSPVRSRKVRGISCRRCSTRTRLHAKIFHGVAQRPGKPAGCWLGPDGQVIMALPGNPVSALTGLACLRVAGAGRGIRFATAEDTASSFRTTRHQRLARHDPPPSRHARRRRSRRTRAHRQQRRFHRLAQERWIRHAASARRDLMPLIPSPHG